MTAPYHPSLLDSLSTLLGGRPAAVRYTQPPEGPTAGGEYRSQNHAYNPSNGDTVFVDPAGNKMNAPLPYVLTHEMGHRLFEQSDPDIAPINRPPGIRDPQLVALAKDLRKQNGYSGHDASEAFAEAFGNAAATMNASALHPAFRDPRSKDATEQQLIAWMSHQPLYANQRGAQIASARQPADATMALPVAGNTAAQTPPVPLRTLPVASTSGGK